MQDNLVTWKIISTKSEYMAGIPKDNVIYFIEDTKEFYKGSSPYNQTFVLYPNGNEPSIKAQNIIYINDLTLEGKVWDGVNFRTVIRPIETTLQSTSNNPVTAKAIAEYIIKAIDESKIIPKKIEWDSSTSKITIKEKTGTVIDSAILGGIGTSLGFNSSTNEIYIKDISGTKIGTGIVLDVERFVTGAEYDSDSKSIILYFDGKTGSASTDKITIPVGDLVDTYTAISTQSVNMGVENNIFSANVKVSSGADNTVEIRPDGLYVKEIDISGKVDKVVPEESGAIATLDAFGNVADSKTKIGGAALAPTPVETTIASEKAVGVIRDSIITSMNTKMAKVSADKPGEILISTADGNASVSGVKIGGATLSQIPTASTLATEAAVRAYMDLYALNKADLVDSASIASASTDASDTAPISEKAVVTSLEWKHGMD